MKDGSPGPRPPWVAAVLIGGLVLATNAPPRAQAADEDPGQFVEFVEDFEATCVAREGVMIMVRSKHPSRPIRIWLERWHMGVNTGDRGKSDLKPGDEAEKLGCSRTLNGKQEWRVVRAQFTEASR